MDGIDICWINESAWQSFPACMEQKKFIFEVTNYKFETKC